ncbi:hypothetical protein [Streptosporangium sp. KLBMP 9127]|nr:hypothetical protein [Streptosporangium sp. KLBMP 9127]
MSSTTERPADTGRFALFAECAITGVWFTVAALPLVTALPAFAASCAHLRKFLYGYRTGLPGFVADLKEACKGSWRVSLAGWAALAVLAGDVVIARSGLPGGPVVAVLTGAAGLAVIVVGLRAAAAWTAGESWAALAGRAAAQARADLAGSALLVGGVVVVAVVTWQLPPLFVPAAGCLAGAALAVQLRGRDG